MSSKDYYRILAVKPTASADDIKRSYRRLAHKYHPDKTPGDIIAEAAFKEIVEAYEILSDSKMRADYHSKRFYTYNPAYHAGPAVTPQSILKEVQHLKKLIERADPFRLNQDALFFQVDQLLNENDIVLLQQKKQHEINRHIIEDLLFVCKLLPYDFTQKLYNRLLFITNDDEKSQGNIQQFYDKQKKIDKWHRYKIIGAILIALLLCLIIFFNSK